MRIIAARERRVEGILRIEAQSRDAAVPGFELHQHFRQLVVAGRSAHHADVRGLFENLLAFLLGHAAEHREGFALAVAF